MKRLLIAVFALLQVSLLFSYQNIELSILEDKHTTNVNFDYEPGSTVKFTVTGIPNSDGYAYTCKWDKPNEGLFELSDNGFIATWITPVKGTYTTKVDIYRTKKPDGSTGGGATVDTGKKDDKGKPKDEGVAFKKFVCHGKSVDLSKNDSELTVKLKNVTSKVEAGSGQFQMKIESSGKGDVIAKFHPKSSAEVIVYLEKVGVRKNKTTDFKWDLKNFVGKLVGLGYWIVDVVAGDKVLASAEFELE